MRKCYFEKRKYRKPLPIIKMMISTIQLNLVLSFNSQKVSTYFRTGQLLKA